MKKLPPYVHYFRHGVYFNDGPMIYKKLPKLGEVIEPFGKQKFEVIHTQWNISDVDNILEIYVK